MKKRVRIYKPTNNFAEGGMQSSQFTPDQATSLFMAALSEPDASIESAEEQLRLANIDEATIAQISDKVQSWVEDEQYMNDALTTADQDEYEDITADQAAIDAATQQEQDALAAAEEEARSDAMQQMYADYSEPDYGDDTDMAGQLIQRYGGMPSKRTFVKNVLKQVKKQMGGDSEPARVDSTDPENKRKERLQTFTAAVQADGDLNLAKQDAEAMYQMLTTPVGGDDSYYESPDMDYAQFGGMRRGQQRRMNRRMNRMIGSLPVGMAGTPGGFMLPNAYDYTDLVGAFGAGQMPAEGSYYRGPKLANIDVRRTGLFGRPKEYTITFANDIVQNPQTAENVVKQEVKNKEEEVKDEAKAAEEGTVDQGVEEKKAEEAATQAEEEAIDINDIQVVSGSGASSNQGGSNAAPEEEYVDESEEVISEKPTPSFRGFWQGYDPKSVRFAGNDKSRAYVQRGNKWFVSPNFTTKDKKNVQWYEVSDPTRIKNIKASTKPIMEPLAPGSTYTLSDGNAAPLSGINNYGKQYPTSTKGVSDKEIIEGLNAYVNKKIPTQARKYPPMSVKDFFLSGQVFNTAGEALNDEFKRYSRPSNMNVPVSKSAPRQAVGLGEKFQQGGFADQSSGLYKFLYGGIDKGKLTQDPYFAEGGLYRFAGEDDSEVDSETNADTKKETPTYLTKDDLTNWWKEMQGQQQQMYDPYAMGYGYNPYMMSYGMPRTKQKGLPYYSGTKNPYTGSLDDAALQSIDVKKSSWLTGMPKKYTVNYQVQKHPLTGQTTTAPATQTKQGLFNRDQKKGFFGNRPDTAFESKSRALSWLGSKLRPVQTESEKVQGQYSPTNQRMISKGYDPETGLTQEELARRNERLSIPDSTFAFTPPQVADVENPEVPDMSSMANYSLPIRRPGLIPTNVQDVEIRPTQYSAPLAPGAAGPLSQREAEIRDLSEAQRMQEEQDIRGFGMNLLGMPTAQDEYVSEAADQNALETQRAEIQRMIEQNPDFFTQGVYNNPVFNPEEMTTSNIIDFNPRPVQQIPVNRVTTPTKPVTPNQKTAPVRNQSNTRQPSKQTEVTRKQSNTPAKNVKVNTSQYDYENTTKGMSKQEKANWQAEQGDASSTMRDLKNEASEGQPKLFRDTYKNYKIDPAYIRSMNKLSPSQRLKYLKAIEKQNRDLYNALLFKYGEYGGYMAYGGTLPQAYIGEDTPINQDERFAPDYESVNWGADFNQDNIPDYLGASTTDMNWKNNTDWMQKPFGFDEQGQYSPQKAVEDMNPQYEDVSADFKTKWGDRGANRRMWLDIFNTGANRVLDWVGQRGDRERERKLRENTLADRLYGSTARRDKGWVETNSGLDIASQYGQRQSGSISKYGGMMYKEGGVTWLSPAQVKWIMENGGDIEFMQ